MSTLKRRKRRQNLKLKTQLPRENLKVLLGEGLLESREGRPLNLFVLKNAFNRRLLGPRG